MATDKTGDGERRDDERLLARAEEALTEIKVSTGLSSRTRPSWPRCGSD